jgi:hypothetical protein
MLALLEKSGAGRLRRFARADVRTGLYAPKEELRKVAELCARYNRPADGSTARLLPPFPWRTPELLCGRTSCARWTSWRRSPAA